MKSLLTVLSSLIFINVNAQNVGIGTTTPNNNAALDITATSKGILIPRMSESERMNISNAPEGLLVYQTNGYKGFWYFNGQEWVTFINCSIESLDCGGAVNSGIFVAGSFGNTTSMIPYTGGLGCAYSGQTISSTGVTGLTANLSSGKFTVGSGNINFSISGIPSSAGVARFLLKIGSQTCEFTRTIYPAGTTTGITTHSCGSANVHNANIPYGTLTDQEGNTYRTVQIGSQLWMAENLKTTKFRNLDPIPNVTDNTAWSGLTTGAWCYLANNASKECPYGKIYNWYAANDTRQICPSGWHIPSTIDLDNLFNYLGGSSVVGGKMKSTGTTYWLSPNTGATNESGFSALPGAYRTDLGSFPYADGSDGFWWNNNQFDLYGYGGFIYVYNTSATLSYSGYLSKKYGYYVRCVKD